MRICNNAYLQIRIIANTHYCKYALLQIRIIVIYIVISKYKKYLLGIINNEESRSDTQFTLVGQFLLCKLNLTRIN